jgi:VIT1/CCC1 family predicted Fe2+/Mn2+ transporter
MIQFTQRQLETLESFFNSIAKGAALAIFPGQAFLSDDFWTRTLIGVALLLLSLFFLILALLCGKGIDHGNKSPRHINRI